ncbi:hypothetical protein [Yersinia ruckeri]|nr:hypothetical protein [Yersinia ruckeri]
MELTDAFMTKLLRLEKSIAAIFAMAKLKLESWLDQQSGFSMVS